MNRTTKRVGANVVGSVTLILYAFTSFCICECALFTYRFIVAYIYLHTLSSYFFPTDAHILFLLVLQPVPLWTS